MNLKFTALRCLRKAGVLAVSAALLLLPPDEARSQPVTLDANFVENLDLAAALTPSVISLAVQTNGRVLVGGQTAFRNGLYEAYPVRLLTNGVIDTGFNPRPDGMVKAATVQEDGRILLGGEFSFLNAQFTKIYGGLARMNTNGTTDTSFEPAIQGSVTTIHLQPDGKLLVAGDIYSHGKQLVRLHANGAIDNGFDASVDGTILALAFQPDGKIVIGGNFSAVGGAIRNRIARLNSDGSLDSDFQADANETVHALALDESGRILAGGSFTSIAGQPRSRIARLNAGGTPDGFAPAVSDTIRSIALEVGGRILVGGDFEWIDGQGRGRLARFNDDGTLDAEFQADADALVHVVGLQLDGKILAGGDFTQIQGQPRAYIARLLNPAVSTQSLHYTNGTITWLRGGSGPELAWAVADVSTNLAGGWQRLGTLQRNVGGWQLLDTPLPPQAFIRARGFISTGNSGWFDQPAVLPLNDPFITSHPTNRTASAGQTVVLGVTAGGTAPFTFQWRKNGADLPDATNATLVLTSVQSANVGNYDVVVSNAVGSLVSYSAFLTVNSVLGDASFVANAGSADVRVLAIQPDGKILAGGYLNTLGGTARVGIGRLNANGSLDGSFVNPAANGAVLTAVLQDDGRILIGGDFTQVGGQPAPFLCRLNTDGTRDPSFTSHPNNVVQALAAQADGRILVGGNFSSFAGAPRSRLARLNPDGTLDLNFNPGANGPVYTLAALPGGRIMAGGAFSELAGVTRNFIGCLESDGSLNSEINPRANDEVYVITPQSDGRLLVGGAFTMLHGEPRNRLGKLLEDGSLDATFTAGVAGGSFTAVLALASQADGMVVAGGWFTTSGNISRTNLVRFLPDGSLDGTFAPAVVGAVNAVTIQPDGNILVGGTFTSLGGQSRSRIGRLANNGSAVSLLDVSETTVTWTRAGTAPELQRASFGISTNGQDWSVVEAARVAGGWQATGLAVPPDSSVRARGFLSAGFQNTSGSIVEVLTNSPVIAP